MPTTPITKEFTHTTCRISVEGKTLTPDRIAELTSPVNCTIELGHNGTSHTFEGDGETLHDLVTTIDRYLKYLLSSQSQGTFSGSVAIRPIDAVRHRITLKQGNSVGQADLTTTQLYDLAESLGEIDDAIPQLARLKTRPQTAAWYRRPAASVAALAVVGVGVVAASVLLTRPSTENLGETSYRVDESISQLEETQLEPTDSTEPPESVVTDEIEPTNVEDPGVLGSEQPPQQAPAAAPSLDDVAGPEAPQAPPESGILEDVEEQPDSDIPSEIGSGEISSDVDINDEVVASAEADAAARSVPSSDTSAPNTSALNAASSNFESESDAELARDTETEPRSRQLSSSLGDSWQAPESLTEPVEYNLTIAEDGTLLSAVPVDERAAEFQAQTPFAELPETSDMEGIQVRVSLAPDSTVTVTELPQSEAP
ncbi:MAG: DUF4335 domain-containing protein [Synechococcus sp.]